MCLKYSRPDVGSVWREISVFVGNALVELVVSLLSIEVLLSSVIPL
ncbi:hypothetical protein MNB_SV-6-1778 [hydrothermal vent metagenome]|uniref:Uncharacterized protein n=1 Tax=hydrothermal vent metagenome TaxID=652676 RepID=A0A1W1BZA6_9ZZZZ